LLLPFGGYLSLDLTVPEANTFFMLMGNAHFPVALGCLLIFWSSLIEQEMHSRGRPHVGRMRAFIAAGVLANLQPFILALALIVALGALLVQWFRSRGLSRERVIRVSMGVVAGVPIAGYLTLGMMRDPLGAQWLAQNKNFTPHIGYVISAYGLLWIPAVWGLVSLRRKNAYRAILLVAWVLITLVGLYSPVSFQRRLSLGLHTAIAASAVLGMIRMEQVVPQTFRERLRRGLLLATIPTNLALILLYSAGVLTRNPKLYITLGEAEALAWLDTQVEEVSVVLSSTELAVFIPAFTDHRAVSGNAFSTPNAKETEAEVDKFFRGSIRADERRRMLQEWGVDYILVGARERAAGPIALEPDACIERIGAFREVELYAVVCPLGFDPHDVELKTDPLAVE